MFRSILSLYLISLIIGFISAVYAENTTGVFEFKERANSQMDMFLEELKTHIPEMDTLAKQLDYVSTSPLVYPPPELYQEPPVQLKNRAIQRIKDYKAYFLKTNNFTDLINDLILAEQELQAAHDLFLKRNNYKEASVCLINLGDSLRMRSRNKESDRSYKQAYKLTREHNLKVQEAHALVGLSRIANNDKRFSEAISFADHAEKICNSLEPKDYECLALALTQTALAQNKLLNLGGALYNLNRIIALSKDKSLPTKQAQTTRMYALVDIGDIYYNLGRKFSGVETGDYAKANSDLSQQAYAAAKENYTKGIELTKKLGFKGLAKRYQNLKNIINSEARRSKYFLSNHVKMAEILENSPALNPKTPNDIVYSDHFIRYGNLLSDFNFSMESLFNNLKEMDATPYDKLIMEGQLYSITGQIDKTIKAFHKAVNLMEAHRAYLLEEDSRQALLATRGRSKIYINLALAFLEQGDNAKAFHYLEHNRARTLADLVLSSRNITFGSQAEQKLFTNLHEQELQLAKGYRSLLESDPLTGPSPQKISQVRKMNLAYQKLKQKISLKAPRMTQLIDSRPVTLASIQADMRKNCYEMLYYLIDSTQLIIWHITDDAVDVKSVFVHEKMLIDKVKTLREKLENIHANEFSDKLARQLFLFLIQPMKDKLKKKNLVIVPDKFLHSLPFQVLKSPNGHYFGELKALSYAPSATVLANLKVSSNLSNLRLLAVAAEDFQGTANDVDKILPFYSDNTYFVTRNINKKNLLRLLTEKEYNLLHLSLHGSFDLSNPMLSYLAVGPNERLNATEMFALPLNKTRLVTLSACEIGKVNVEASNEISGMLRALLYAGAQSLLLPAWKIDAEATALWMEAFYRTGQTLPPAKAAKEALLSLKSNKKYKHPRYWGGFLLTGK